jgi:hypothetical protein
MPALPYLLYHQVSSENYHDLKSVDDSANKLTYETDILVETNETFLKQDKALVGRSLVQANKNVFVRVMNPSADTQVIYPGTIVSLFAESSTAPLIIISL